MPPRSQKIIHTPSAIFLSGLPGVGKSTTADLIADMHEKAVGVRPRIFRIDDYGKPDADDPKYEHELYPKGLIERRYNEMADEIESHIQQNPYVPLIVDSPYNHPRFRQLVERVMVNPRFATYTIGLQADIPTIENRVRTAIEKGEDRRGSRMQPHLVRPYAEKWKGDFFVPTKTLDNNSSKKDRLRNLRPLLSEIVEETTEDKVDDAEVSRTIGKIQAEHGSPKERLDALILELVSRYGFDRLGMAQLSRLVHHQRNPGQVLLHPISTMEFLSKEAKIRGPTQDTLSPLAEALPAGVWNGRQSEHVTAKSPFLWYHPTTQIEVDAGAFSDHFYYPLGRFEDPPTNPLATHPPGPEALVGFLSIHLKNPDIFKEMDSFLKHPSVKDWARALWDEQDESEKSVRTLAEKIVAREKNAGSVFSQNVATLSVALAKKMGYNKEKTLQVYYSALLHRMGSFDGNYTFERGMSDEERKYCARASNRRLPQLPADHPVIRGATECHYSDDLTLPTFVDQESQSQYLSNLGFLEQSAKSEPKKWTRKLSELYENDDTYRKVLSPGFCGDLTPDMIKQLVHGFADLNATRWKLKDLHPYARIVRVASWLCQQAGERPLEDVLSSLRRQVVSKRMDVSVAKALLRIPRATLSRIVKRQKTTGES